MMRPNLNVYLYVLERAAREPSAQISLRICAPECEKLHKILRMPVQGGYSVIGNEELDVTLVAL